MVKLSSHTFEAIFLLGVMGLFLFVGAGQLLNHQISHHYPYGFYAMDGTTHLAFAEALYNQGTLNYLPSYMAAGHTDVVSANPPVVYTLVVSFAYLAGISAHDALVLVLLLLFIFCSMVMYLFIRRFNQVIAIVALPFAYFLLVNPFFSALSWGEYPFIIGILFLLAGIAALPFLQLPSFFVILALFMATLFLAHASEFVVLLGLFFIFYLVHFFWKKEVKQNTQHFLGMGSIVILLVFHYYILFKNTFVKLQLQTSLKPIFTAGYLVPEFGKDFPLVVVFVLLAGMVLAFIGAFNYFKKGDEKWIIPVTFLYLLLITYTNLIGQKRALQMRLLWPVLLMFFFGLLIYYILSKMKWDLNKAVPYFISVILLIAFTMSYYTPLENNPGLVDPYTGEALRWIRANTPEDSTVLFFHGDAYSQHTLLNLAERRVFRVNRDDQIAKVQSQSFPQYFLIQPEVFLDTWLPYRKSFSEFGYYYEENESRYQPAEMDLCSFDYLVFNKYSQARPLAEYNIAMAQQLLQANNSLVFNNNLIVIVHNNNVGGACM